MIKTDAPISNALRLAAVSVDIKGFPVPAARITTLPFSMCRIARRRIYGSATDCIGMAVTVRTGTFSRSSQSCSTSAFMTVANMPAWSAVLRSMP